MDDSVTSNNEFGVWDDSVNVVNAAFWGSFMLTPL